jgi:hypothetical protein
LPDPSPSFAVAGAQLGQPKERRDFLLDLDDGLGRGELAGQALILVAQARELGRVDRRGGLTTSVRRERGECSLRAVAVPLLAER